MTPLVFHSPQPWWQIVSKVICTVLIPFVVVSLVVWVA